MPFVPDEVPQSRGRFVPDDEQPAHAPRFVFDDEQPKGRFVPDDEQPRRFVFDDEVGQPKPAPKARTWYQAAGDTAVDVAKGVVGLGESVVGLTDLVTGNMSGSRQG